MLFRCFGVCLIFLLFCISSTTHSRPNHQYHKVIVKISGLDKNLMPLVLGNLSIKAAENEKKLNEERIESLHLLANAEITKTLEALGYYHSHIYENLAKKNEVYYANYQIEKGSPTLITRVSVKVIGPGSELAEVIDCMQAIPFKEGEQINHNQYETFKQNLLSRTLQLGYLDASFTTSEILVNQDLCTAEIVMVLDTGNRYWIGNVMFQKNPYPEDYLMRYLPWKETVPVPYTTENLLTLQKTLTDTELFRYIRIDPDLKENQDYLVPLNIRLKPKPQNRYIGSIGYGTDTGVRGMLGFEHRRFSHPGHRINLEVRGSRWRNNANIRYSLPGPKPATDRFVFAFFVAEEKWRDHKYSLREDLSATFIQKSGKLETMFSIHDLVRERYRELPGFPKKNAHLLYPDLALLFTDITQVKPKEEGLRLSLSLRGANKWLLSSASFVQGNLLSKMIFGLDDSTRVILRGELGATAIHNPRNLPLSMRFFAGGDQTVRGFGYRSLGPQLPDKYGDLINIGGRYLAIGSIEIERQLYKEYSAAIFYDTGQAMNKWRVRFAKSIGVGLRFQTPLGPLRLDIAQPLNIVEKKVPRIHLSLGADL